MRWTRALGGAAGLAAAGIAAYDLVQRRHALLRNYPIIGHGRYLIEAIGPEMRQYVVAGNNEERPFSRDQRRWVYASSKMENNYFGFGTDNDVENALGYPIIKHRTFADQSLTGFDKTYSGDLPLSKSVRYHTLSRGGSLARDRLGRIIRCWARNQFLILGTAPANAYRPFACSSPTELLSIRRAGGSPAREPQLL